MSPSMLAGELSNDSRDVSDDVPQFAGQFDGSHVLVPLLSSEGPAVTDQLKIATTLTRVTGATLSVLEPVSEGTPGEHRHEIVDENDSALLNRALDRTADATPQIEGEFLYTREPVAGLLRAIRARDIDTLVLPSGSQGGRLRTGVIDRIAVHADCDVVVVNGQAGYEQVRSILLPVAGGPHSGLAADVSRSIAADCDAWVDVMHVVDPENGARSRRRAQELVDTGYRRVARPATTTTWILEAPDPAAAIVEQSQYYGLTIIGAPTKGRLRQLVFGSTNRSVRSGAGSVVLSVQNNSPPEP